MTREDALELWGADAVERALAEPAPEPISRELIRECRARTQLPPGAFRAWTLTLPWPRFCAVVRIVSGVAREEMLDDDDG
jgi:anti-sigma factor RsiW